MSKDADVNAASSYATAALNFSDLALRVHDAATTFAGSSGLPGTPGAADVGALQTVTTTAAQPYIQHYVQTAASGPTRGYRQWKAEKVLVPSDLVTVVAATTTSSDVAWTTPTLTLDADLQDASQTEFLVTSLTLVVGCRFTTSTHPGGDKLYVAVRRGDGTLVRKVYCSGTVNVWTEQEIVMPLDSSEEFDYAVDTNAAGNTVGYYIKYKRGTERI